MSFFSDFKELSAWIIGIAALLVIFAVVYTRNTKDNPNT
jgi:hypothetical protein